VEAKGREGQDPMVLGGLDDVAALAVEKNYKVNK
jgi:hypothetical protein